MRYTIIAALLYAVPAAAQTTLPIGVYRPPSQAALDLLAEQAKHPNEHWVCTASDWNCLQGYWQPDMTDEELQAKADASDRAMLGAMRAADKAASQK
jgi:hypothetical protein